MHDKQLQALASEQTINLKAPEDLSQFVLLIK